jgi:membrane-bound lytic murein transglycosylase D
MLLLAFALVMTVWAGDRAASTRVVVPPVTAAAVFAPPELPLHINSRVERWIDEFQTTRRDEFTALLERRGLFENLIRTKLRDRGLPEDLLYLAVIESGLSPRAVSRVSAVGLWQFMDPTAREMGLRVDDYVDERRDPVRATDAALDYLEELHQRFGSWYLAAAAYNAGPGRVERVLRLYADGRTGEEEIYWEVLRHLPLETREYVPRLVATTILANDADNLGFAASTYPEYVYDVVFVPGGTRLEAVAETLGEGGHVLRDLNPHLVRGVTPPGEIYGVRVPIGGPATVVASLSPRPLARPMVVD